MVSEPASSATPTPRPSIKTRSSPAAFPTTLCLPFFPLHSPHTTVVPQASAGSTFPLQASSSNRKIRHGLWHKCLSTTARFDSLDTPVALSYQTSDCGSSLDEDS